MSTTDRESPVRSPWLVDGQSLDRVTFHQRYQAMPPETRAELVGGVVYLMASPLARDHGKNHMSVSLWIGRYMVATPGTEALDNATIFFDDFGEPQPDMVLRILPQNGGRTRDDGKYYANGPELVVEVSDSTLPKDLGPKLQDYERAGVPEYIIVGVDPPRVRWHVLRDGKLIEVDPDPDGIYRSKVFPGLWLDPAALLQGDIPALWAWVDRGVATPQHVDFVARLAIAGREAWA